MGYIQGDDRYQLTLFRETIDSSIAPDNEVRVIDAFVDSLDMQSIGVIKYAPAHTGRPAYDPRVHLKLYIYGLLNSLRSSRRLERETARNIEVMWLLQNLRPDFKTIADFRKHNKAALVKVFQIFVAYCRKWELLSRELAAIDGAKYRANNSKRNNFSRKKLDRHINYIDNKIASYLNDIEENDVTEDLEPEKGKPSAKYIRKRVEDLTARKHHYEDMRNRLNQQGINEVSTTDPDARLMSNNNNNVDVSYNVQKTVEGKNKLIVDFKVTQSPNDLGELDNMALRAKRVLDVESLCVLADKGYYRAEDLKRCVAGKITPYVAKQTFANRTGDKDFYIDKFIYDKKQNVYICPAGQQLHFAGPQKKQDKVIGYKYKNYAACSNCELKARCTKSKKGRHILRHVDQDFLDEIDSQTALNIETYKLRQMIVEHPIGTIKRGWNAYYFLTRGKRSVKAECALAFLCYNLKRVINIFGVEKMVMLLKEEGDLARA